MGMFVPVTELNEQLGLFEGCALGTLPEQVVPYVINFVTPPWAAAEKGGGGTGEHGGG